MHIWTQIELDAGELWRASKARTPTSCCPPALFLLLLLPGNIPWFSRSLTPKELSHYFKMPDHFNWWGIMNQGYLRISLQSSLRDKAITLGLEFHKGRWLAKYLDNLASVPFLLIIWANGNTECGLQRWFFLSSVLEAKLNLRELSQDFR